MTTRQAGRRAGVVVGFALAAMLGAACPSFAQGPAPAAKAQAGAVDAAMLKGAWRRPDGGYIIAITNVDANGELTALYFNPNQLPFAKAQATRSGETLRASFELQAGGYNGSTYELAYDAANDRLVGSYFQAVAKQKYEVYFVRQRMEAARR